MSGEKLPQVHTLDDGTKVMKCREVAAFSHLTYPKYLARLRQRLDANPRCWRFFPGLPHPLPAKKSLEEYDISTTASGITLTFQNGAATKALLRAFDGETIPPSPDASGERDEDADKATAGDDKYLVVMPPQGDREAMADSRDVARYFGKNHWDVLKAYRNLGCSLGFRKSNFAAVYINGLDGDLSHVLMTKNGFAFLVLGFTGAEADRFKEAWILKYDSMERRQESGAKSHDWWNDPATMRQVLIEATYKIEEANARADSAEKDTVHAKAETKEERDKRIAAEARAASETERALQQEELAARERVAREVAEVHAREADETLESVLARITEGTGNWKLEAFASVQLHASPASQLRERMLTDKNKMLKRHYYEPLKKYITLPEQWTINSGLLDTEMTRPPALNGVQVPVVIVTPKGQRYLLRRYWGKLKTSAPIVDPDQPTLDLNRKRSSE